MHRTWLTRILYIDRLLFILHYLTLDKSLPCHAELSDDRIFLLFASYIMINIFFRMPALQFDAIHLQNVPGIRFSIFTPSTTNGRVCKNIF